MHDVAVKANQQDVMAINIRTALLRATVEIFMFFNLCCVANILINLKSCDAPSARIESIGHGVCVVFRGIGYYREAFVA